jgi:hypothetical protein
MDAAPTRATYDWLAELAGAAAPGLAAGYAALKLAPSLSVAPGLAVAVAASAASLLGLAAMRAVSPGSRDHALPGFALPSIVRDSAEPLLLDVVHAVRRTGDGAGVAPADEAILLLDDPLVADPDSRVVRLFAALPEQAVLAEPLPDASEALYAALAELRRSLR